MRVSTKIFAGAAVAASVMLAAASANAVQIVPFSTGPFDAGNPSGVVPANTFAQGTDTDDFTFTIDGSVSASTLMQLQMSKVSNGAPRVLAFELFSGTPGTGTAVAPSGGTPTAAALKELLAPGSYYLEVSTNAEPKDLVTGGITILSGGIPEPATWAMMIAGFGLLGVAGRRRRALGVAAV